MHEPEARYCPPYSLHDSANSAKVQQGDHCVQIL